MESTSDFSSSKGELLGIILSYHNPNTKNSTLLSEHLNLKSISYFHRKALRQILHFLTKSLLQQFETSHSLHTSLQDSETCSTTHIYALDSIQIRLFAFSTQDYPAYHVFKVLEVLWLELKQLNPEFFKKDAVWDDVDGFKIKRIEEVFDKNRFIREVDLVSLAREKTEGVQEVLQNDLRKMLGTKQDLIRLVDTSEELNKQAKMFLTEGKKMNKRCCVIF